MSGSCEMRGHHYCTDRAPIWKEHVHQSLTTVATSRRANSDHAVSVTPQEYTAASSARWDEETREHSMVLCRENVQCEAFFTFWYCTDRAQYLEAPRTVSISTSATSRGANSGREATCIPQQYTATSSSRWDQDTPEIWMM